MLAASGLDRWVGDPRSLLHPVQVMGWGITVLRQRLEPLAGGRPWALRVLGGLITTVVVLCSGLAGWGLERCWLDALARLVAAARAVGPLGLSLPGSETAAFGGLPLIALLLCLGLLPFALASALAGRSLEDAVLQVLEALPRPSAGPGATAAATMDPEAELGLARQRLAWIVGRDTTALDRTAIVRAAAETASENAVDGLFGPLFWMLVGVLLWQMPGAPGPLSLAWGFKAASTLDSMLGYRRGSLRWLGTAGARLDDLLTWLPCRLVAFSLPVVSGQRRHWSQLGAQALLQGAADPSPNAGVSQAIYALVLGLQLGGASTYGGELRHKPLVGRIGAQGVAALQPAAVLAMLALSRRLQSLWLLLAGLLSLVLFITKTLS